MAVDQKSAYRFAIAAIICWSSVSTAFKISLRYLTPLGLLLFSSVTAAILLTTYCIATQKQRFFAGLIKNMHLSFVSSLLNPFLYYLVLFEAYNRLRAQEAQVLNYTWAIVLPVMSVFILKQGMKFKDLGGLLLGFIGVIIIATRGAIRSLAFDDWFGSLLAIGSSVIWAAYWLINMKDKRNPALKLSFNFIMGAAMIGIYYLIRVLMGSEIRLFTIGDSGLRFALMGAAYVGIFEMGLTFLLWFKALTLSRTTALVSNLIFFTPFVSMFLIQGILGERIHYSTIMGLGLIIAGNMIQKTGWKHKSA